MSAWFPAIIAATIAGAVALAGGLLTDVGPWYRNLRKPRWNPPDWAFGPVWTVIFILAAIAGTKAWNEAGSAGWRQLVVALFALNACLNVMWSWLFFRLRRPDWAMIETVCLWLSVFALMAALAPISTNISLLLAPYLIWVSIASLLNWKIYVLNRPFPTHGGGE